MIITIENEYSIYIKFPYLINFDFHFVSFPICSVSGFLSSTGNVVIQAAGIFYTSFYIATHFPFDNQMHFQHCVSGWADVKNVIYGT